MRDWMTASDEWLSLQAAVLSPTATLRIAEAIVGESTPYRCTVAAGRAAIAILHDAIMAMRIRLSRKETQWLNRIGETFEALPEDEGAMVEAMEVQYGSLYDRTSYGMDSAAVSTSGSAKRGDAQGTSH